MTGRRLSFSGSAVPTSLVGAITAGAMTFSVAAITNWPNTAIGPFVLVLDRGNISLEEKVLISSYSGTTVTVLQRGYDGTTPQAHGNGAPVVHTWDAVTADQANDVVNGVGTVAPHASAVGDTASNGTSKYPAAADHVHAREQFASGATAASAPGDARFDGVSTSPARADHRHAREAAAVVETPIGAIVMWPTNSIPTNWLPMQGQTIASGAVTYPGLAAVCPGSWISGSDIVLPDTRDRFPVGAGNTYAVGATGGSANVSLATGHIPQFSNVSVAITDPGHGHSDAGHSHATPGNLYSNQSSSLFLNPTSTPGTDWVTFILGAPTGNGNANIQNSPTGISGKVTFGSATPTPVPTVPPYFAVVFIVKAA